MDRLLRDAHSLWDNGELSAAFKLFMTAAAQKKSESYNNIGYMLEYGLGVEENKNEALKWYKKAARAGELVALNNIGLWYMENNKINLAKKWLTKSVNYKYHASALSLAKLYINYLKDIGNGKKYAILTIESDFTSQFDKDEAKKILKDIS